ncbi:MAG: hypothetical protein CVV22_03975 [Ignavibacteriae bacterium HGW-Ignavibacteriae-1]|jgi:hypothetical protein|nr:MAG: hypothetical protein CVV22_03975 [Ignavibacteriae bacterium HGW-Ignavibacteriae-1]
MKVFFAILILTVLIGSESLYSQEKASPGTAPMTYTVRVNFPVNVHHSYTFTEISKITRNFSDGTTKQFDRELTYYFALRAPNDASKDGFNQVEVSVDSLEYKFSDGDTIIFFNSQADDMRMPGNDDYKIASIPLGMTYLITYSPYNEIVKVEGDRLEAQRNYLTNPATGPRDSLVKNTWLIGLSDIVLNNYFDIVKSIPPTFKATKDTSWAKAVPVSIENSQFIDSAKFTLTQITPKNYVIEGQSQKFTPQASHVRMFDIMRLLQLSDVTGTANYTMMLHPRGTVNEFKAVYKLDFTYPLLSEDFKQTIETTRHWKLGNMYMW